MDDRSRAYLCFIVKLKLRLSHVLDEFHQIYACTVTLNFFTYCTYYNKYTIRLNIFFILFLLSGLHGLLLDLDGEPSVDEDWWTKCVQINRVFKFDIVGLIT